VIKPCAYITLIAKLSSEGAVTKLRHNGPCIVQLVEYRVFYVKVGLMWCVQVVEYDEPSVLLDNSESAFSRLVDASRVEDASDFSAV